MNRIKIKKLGLTIFQKTLMIFIVAMLPIILVSALTNRSGQETLSREIANSLQSNAHFYLNSFEMEMQRVVRMKKQYMSDATILDLMRFNRFYSDSEQVSALQEIERKLLQFKESSLFVSSIQVSFPKIDYTVYDHKIEFSAHTESITPIDFTSHIRQNENRLIMQEQYPLLTSSKENIELYMEIELSQQNMKSSLEEISSYNNGEAFIFQNDGDWIIGELPDSTLPYQELLELLGLNKAEQPSNGYSRFSINNESYVFAYETSPYLDATIVVFLLENNFLGPIKQYNKIYYLLAITALLVILFFSIWLYNYIHKPMFRLTKAFRLMDKGDFVSIVEIDRKDEFHYLYQQFNEMSSRLKSLIQDVYEHELRLNRAELKQLQAQINPHFLYNIFFLLNRIIKLEDIETAKLLTKNLGHFFQFITRNGEDEVTLDKEYAHIQSYIVIQRIRFGQRLKVELEPLPEQARNVAVPRLIMQPIVENAFEYGLEDHEEQGELHISFTITEGKLCVHFMDNGHGLTEAKLEELKMKLLYKNQSVETTGLINIHRRLKLKFGDHYGLTARKSSLGGMHIMMTLPMEKEREG